MYIIGIALGITCHVMHITGLVVCITSIVLSMTGLMLFKTGIVLYITGLLKETVRIQMNWTENINLVRAHKIFL